MWVGGWVGGHRERMRGEGIYQGREPPFEGDLDWWWVVGGEELPFTGAECWFGCWRGVE